MPYVRDDTPPEAAIDPETAADLRDPVSLSGAGLARVYTRFVGGIQLLYALIFGLWAYQCFEDVCFWAFGVGEGVFKGGLIQPYLDKEELFLGIILGSLFVFGLIGGSSLLRLRPGVRIWQIAYLALLTILLIAISALHIKWPFDARAISENLTGNVLFYLAFALPYVPFLVVSPSPEQRKGNSAGWN
jgi:hypothetical protein